MREEKKRDTELNSVNTKSKRPYEKPAMKAIALFADQVLGTCGKVGTLPSNECSTGTPGNSDGASS